jgi:hypothetical protein
MKAILCLIGLCILGQAKPVMAAPSCPPRARDEGEPFLEKAPVIPKKYRSIIAASKTDLAVATETGKTICVKLGWIADIENYWNSPDMRFIGFDYSGYETHGHVMIDSKGVGQEIATGARPVFSPDNKHFAFVQLTDSGWGNFEGAAIWSVEANNSSSKVNYDTANDKGPKLPYGIDWKIDRWINNNGVSLSMIHPDELVSGDDYTISVARSPRRHYQFRRHKQTWRFHDCATSGWC